jgi:hypothetical protein
MSLPRTCFSRLDKVVTFMVNWKMVVSPMKTARVRCPNCVVFSFIVRVMWSSSECRAAVCDVLSWRGPGGRLGGSGGSFRWRGVTVGTHMAGVAMLPALAPAPVVEPVTCSVVAAGDTGVDDPKKNSYQERPLTGTRHKERVSTRANRNVVDLSFIVLIWGRIKYE